MHPVFRMQGILDGVPQWLGHIYFGIGIARFCNAEPAGGRRQHGELRCFLGNDLDLWLGLGLGNGCHVNSSSRWFLKNNGRPRARPLQRLYAGSNHEVSPTRMGRPSVICVAPVSTAAKTVATYCLRPPVWRPVLSTVPVSPSVISTRSPWRIPQS